MTRRQRQRTQLLLFALSDLDWDDDSAIGQAAHCIWTSAMSDWGKERMEVPNTKAKIPHVVLTDRYAQSVAYASAIHATQTRKGEGNTTAYISHLLAVSALVLEAGGDEDQAIAGLLHDAAEDAGGEPRLVDIKTRFGDDVAKIVRACSDSTDEEWKKATPYWDRKQAYLEHLEQADPRAVLVSIADKVHNARAIVTDLRINHTQDAREYLNEKFNGTPDEVLTYYEECLRIGGDKGVPRALTVALEDAVTFIRQSIGVGAA